jgi:hypothetical protein
VREGPREDTVVPSKIVDRAVHDIPEAEERE